MTRKRSLSEGLEFLLHNDRQRLIHGVLKGLYLRPSDSLYDDYFQDACLLFATAYVDFGREPLTDTEDFLHFAYQRIRWRLLDRIRRARWQADNNELSLDNPLLSETQKEILTIDPHSADPAAGAAHKEVIRQLKQVATPKQRRYLHAVFDLGLSDSEIARRYHESRQTVYAWRQGVIKRARANQILP